MVPPAENGDCMDDIFWLSVGVILGLSVKIAIRIIERAEAKRVNNE